MDAVLKTDSVFYRLFQRLPGLVFELAGWPTPDLSGYQFRSEEIKQTAFRLDGVLTPPADALDRPLVFVEVQYQPDARFYARFFSEIFLYLYRQPLAQPWRAVVIYPERGVERAAEPHCAVLLDSPLVQRVYLEDFQTLVKPTFGLRLLQLLVGDPAQAVSRAQDLLQPTREQQPPSAAWRDIVDLVETLLVYRLPALSREEIRNMLNLVDVELKQTRFYQEVFTEGRQEGRQEGIAELAIRQLRRRFSDAISSAQVERIQRLPLADVEALAEALLDFQTPADLAAWLAARKNGNP